MSDYFYSNENLPNSPTNVYYRRHIVCQFVIKIEKALLSIPLGVNNSN